MSGVRAYGMPPYAHIEARECPVCHRMIKNFERHTRDSDVEHLKLRHMQDQIFRKLILDPQLDRGSLQDSGVVTALGQKAWHMAIEMMKK